MSYFSLYPLFPLGDIRISPAVEGQSFDVLYLIRRHQGGDWGHVCEEIREDNERAVSNNEPILSQYWVPFHQGGEKAVIVMTEGDRGFTVVFLADDSDV